MPVCIRCGAQLNNTAKFCGYCGYPVKQHYQAAPQNTAPQNNASSQNVREIVCLRCGKRFNPIHKICWNCGCPSLETAGSGNDSNNSEYQKVWTREAYIAELDRMIDYFSKMQPLYDEYYTSKRKRDKKEKEVDIQIHKRYSGFEGKRTSDILANRRLRHRAFGFWAVGILLIFLIIYFASSFGWPLSLLVTLGCFHLCVLCVFLGFVMWNKVPEEEKKLNDEVIQISREADSVYTKLLKHYKSYGYCLLGFDDTYPRRLVLMRDYMKTNRADTLEKARKMAEKQLGKYNGN